MAKTPASPPLRVVAKLHPRRYRPLRTIPQLEAECLEAGAERFIGRSRRPTPRDARGAQCGVHAVMPGDRMHEREALGVCKARRGTRAARSEDRPGGRRRRDRRSADDRSLRGDADLVRATGLEAAAHERRDAMTLDDVDVSARRPPWRRRPSSCAGRMAPDRCIDDEAARKIAVREREIVARHRAAESCRTRSV